MVAMVSLKVGDCEGECGSQEEMSARRSEIAMARAEMRRMANMRRIGLFPIAELCLVAMSPLPTPPRMLCSTPPPLLTFVSRTPPLELSQIVSFIEHVCCYAVSI